MNRKSFDEFMKSGKAKTQTPNRQRAISLAKEAKDKKEFLNISIASIPPQKMNPNFIVDSCYDIMLEMIRARMLLDGFNAGSSHEAEVSYMERLGFPETDISFMDEIRYYRNGTKYYGTILSTEYANKVLSFMKRVYPKLKAMVGVA
jgi:hypothetical protein